MSSETIPLPLLPLVPSESFESVEREYAAMRSAIEAISLDLAEPMDEAMRTATIQALLIASARAQATWTQMASFDGQIWIKAHPLNPDGLTQ